MSGLLVSAASLDFPINWQELKTSSSNWHSELYTTTEKVLTEAATKFSDLSSLNPLGVFHKIPADYGKAVMDKYRVSKQIPKEWPSLGKWPGIWCALFDPHNTYSMASDLFIIKMSFKQGYRIFDSANPDHCTLWTEWKSTHVNRHNEWAEAKNDKGISMKERAAGFMFGLSPKIPNHIEFYRDNMFGCTVGYSDYMALMVLLPECVQHVEQVIPIAEDSEAIILESAVENGQ